ncbi:MAG: choloylglycine hydrolase [Dehalococcoidia bacterium]|nr:choloylglycine hydrolase [Dehalococcoidia bacterium]
MYHPRLTGRHYDMGYRCGSLIKKNDVHLSQVIKLSTEKREFGLKCIAACQEVFPEAVEELQGLADGLQLPFSKFAGWIFCIYCYEYKRGCTCFVVKDDNNIIFGRNSDFFVEIRDVCESALYLPDRGYRFIGNSTALVQMEDGYNEHGLAIGLTFIPPKIIKPGLNAGILLRYILEKCKTVKEAIEALYLLPVSSAQTFTMIDKTGEMAVVECNCEKIILISRRENENYLVSTNQFVSPEMQRYEILSFIDSRERYQVARKALKMNNVYSSELARDILSGKYGLMCQYERESGFDTLWSTVYDLKNDRILRAEGNPSKARFKEDTRLRRAKETRKK